MPRPSSATSPQYASSKERTLAAFGTYFASGWAFLIPYLAFYLVYHALKWPANPGHGARHAAIPPLLYVYWGLHGINLGLGIFTLALPWLRARERRKTGGSPAVPLTARFKAVLPWLALAGLFYIPGAYLEFPADPWMHFARITEWASHPIVGFHSAGYKSFYFFAYSLIGRIPAAHQLGWVDVYHTGVSLLLCWQYYLLARETGLERRWAQLFVFVNVLTFGNVVFSFYRYYSLASTIYAQIGTVALIRVAIRWTRIHLARTGPQGAERCSTWKTVGAGVALVLLVGANHVQGVGLIALGLCAVATWGLIGRSRWNAVLLAGVATVASLAVFQWWPRAPGFEIYFRPHAWLDAWGGFAFFDPQSLAADRMMQIFGFFGLCNLAAALALLWRNEIAAWLTITPVLLLALPCGAIPLADTIARGSGGPNYIITYHRMFYAIPFGLAMVTLARSLTRSVRWQRLAPATRSNVAFAGVVASLLAFAVVPITSPWFNRFWHVIVRPPADLSLRLLWPELARVKPELQARGITRVASTTAIVHTLFTMQTAELYIPGKTYPYAPGLNGAPRLYTGANRAPDDDFAAIELAMKQQPLPALVTIDPATFTTPYSTAAVATGHWLPQEVQLAAAGMPELEALATSNGYSAIKLGKYVTLHVPPEAGTQPAPH